MDAYDSGSCLSQLCTSRCTPLGSSSPMASEPWLPAKLKHLWQQRDVISWMPSEGYN
jgi:hypothetical protein